MRSKRMAGGSDDGEPIDRERRTLSGVAASAPSPATEALTQNACQATASDRDSGPLGAPLHHPRREALT
jgi:hypothetical protein